MKTLIVGGTSALGRALKPNLSEFSDVITAGRKNCDITLDLNDPLEVMRLPSDITAIIHTAASFGGTTDAEILDAEYVNVLGTLKLCRLAAKAKAKHFILISSIFACLTEHSKFYGIYALSKKHSEEVAQLYCSSRSLPLTILRPSQIYGDEEQFRKHQPFLYFIADRAEEGEDISLYGSHDALRNYIHIDDLTKIISKVIQHNIKGTYPCMHTTDVSYSQVAKAAISAFGSKGNVRFLRDKTDIPDNIFEKDSSLYQKIGFYPQISIENGMERIASYRRSLSR